MANILTCPLCKDETLVHTTKTMRSNAEIRHHHIYVCEECPFVGMEFYNAKDLASLIQHLGYVVNHTDLQPTHSIDVSKIIAEHKPTT